jgi:hypothetical protein
MLHRGAGTPSRKGASVIRMASDPKVTLFRRLALTLPGAVESAHMGHPDFRLNNRIFATLSAQEKGCGVLKLTREQQTAFVTDQPDVFSPVQGGWGRMGMTFLHLNHADESIMAGALQTAYRNLQQKQSQKKKPAITQKKSAKSAIPAKTSRRPLQ